MWWDFPGIPEVKTVLPLQDGKGSIPGQGTKISHEMQCGQSKQKHWMVFLPPKRYKRKIFFMKNISLWDFHFCPFHNLYNVFFLMSFFLAEKHNNKNRA